eukprot:TRINITY_DN2824_c0_g1_i3.p1 TRINITY_DN2824_c0_g1~~TRINITY_DN2824_c0_g1_i3.p1  ORF type:complete len:459 (-),score=91.86 TRINITY_DN2824_c0_g1_i3:1637-3013(-)
MSINIYRLVGLSALIVLFASAIHSPGVRLVINEDGFSAIPGVIAPTVVSAIHNLEPIEVNPGSVVNGIDFKNISIYNIDYSQLEIELIGFTGVDVILSGIGFNAAWVVDYKVLGFQGERSGIADLNQTTISLQLGFGITSTGQLTVEVVNLEVLKMEVIDIGFDFPAAIESAIDFVFYEAVINFLPRIAPTAETAINEAISENWAGYIYLDHKNTTLFDYSLTKAPRFMADYMTVNIRADIRKKEEESCKYPMIPLPISVHSDHEFEVFVSKTVFECGLIYAQDSKLINNLISQKLHSLVKFDNRLDLNVMVAGVPEIKPKANHILDLEAILNIPIENKILKENMLTLTGNLTGEILVEIVQNGNNFSVSVELSRFDVFCGCNHVSDLVPSRYKEQIHNEDWGDLSNQLLEFIKAQIGDTIKEEIPFPVNVQQILDTMKVKGIEFITGDDYTEFTLDF